MNLFKCFCLIAIFYSCKQNGSFQNQINNAKVKKEDVNYKVKDTSDSLKKGLLEKQISVKSIKSQIDGVTTTFLSKKQTSIFKNRENSNFYGYYTLIKNDKNGVPKLRIGNLIVYDSINPFVYEKDTDEFVEIFLKKKGVNLYDGKLRVGMKLSLLVDQFGEWFEKYEDRIVYKNKNKIAIFRIKDSLVNQIRIGVYRQGITIDEVLKRR